MLITLRLKNFAVVEEAEVGFGAGLTVLTGETGAGKSILIDALQLALQLHDPGQCTPKLLTQ